MKINAENIWLVDDDEIYQFITKTYFEFDDPRRNITSFPNGKAAIENLQHASEPNIIPDIILLDINMPVMNGWDFMDEYEKIKTALKKHPSIFLVTSSDNQIDTSKANHYADIKDYIVKPVDNYKIKSIIKRATEE